MRVLYENTQGDNKAQTEGSMDDSVHDRGFSCKSNISISRYSVLERQISDLLLLPEGE